MELSVSVPYVLKKVGRIGGGRWERETCLKLHSSCVRSWFYSRSKQMLQFNVNSRVVVSSVDVSANVSLSAVRRLLLKMPNARWGKLCVRYLAHSGNDPVEDAWRIPVKVLSKWFQAQRKRHVEEISCTAGIVLLNIGYLQREQPCRRHVMHGRKSLVKDINLWPYSFCSGYLR